ncbi:response regulator transcription factor [Cupriavidus agavae]|uniref:FixJ family two-component response regulator n=1 Tax=Cupriavidus agavae TaxID=1001822 RepID=A0A4Q7RT55_9BURK|nr:response regulator [Cupriavidus agavae]RZT36831.1 FixJ family two-component response regulator [Cupriavidus agavae]
MQAGYAGSQKPPTSSVLVVDDDGSVRSSVCLLLRSLGYDAKGFSEPGPLFAETMPEHPCCIILDVRIREHSGLDVQTRLRDAGVEIPVVFLSGYGDIAMTASVMKRGAVTFLVKPYRAQDLIDAVNEAIQRDVERRTALSRGHDLRTRYESLTGREKETMLHLAKGLTNNEVAALLGISGATVKIYRAEATRKMGARSFAGLVRMAEALGMVTCEALSA